MKLTLANKIELIHLSEEASNLMIKFLEEKNPISKTPTKNGLKFKKTLKQIYQICPLLSEGYVKMYNHIQKEKINTLYPNDLKVTRGHKKGINTLKGINNLKVINKNNKYQKIITKND